MVPEATLDESALMPAGAQETTPDYIGYCLPADEHIMTEAQAAIFLHMSLYRLKQLRKKQQGPRYVKINNNVILYSRADIVRWFANI